MTLAEGRVYMLLADTLNVVKVHPKNPDNEHNREFTQTQID